MRVTIALLLISVALLGATAARTQGWPIERYSVEGRNSGYFYLGRQTRLLQDDDFQNPGIFAVDQGAAMWRRVEGSQGRSCQSCHQNAVETMKGVATRYPAYDQRSGSILNLELVINRERVEKMGAAPLAYESPELLAITAFVSHQSRGLPKNVDVTGAAAPFFEQGKEFWNTRRGQIDISCAMCHDDRVGMLLRGDTISQGQTNGHPMYRLIWSSISSTHRMFQWCNTSMRAEPYPLGSPEYLALELYVAWRGRGLPVETPSVRK
jgi:sulfur-oxidizing protein SoxA